MDKDKSCCLAIHKTFWVTVCLVKTLVLVGMLFGLKIQKYTLFGIWKFLGENLKCLSG